MTTKPGPASAKAKAKMMMEVNTPGSTNGTNGNSNGIRKEKGDDHDHDLAPNKSQLPPHLRSAAPFARMMLATLEKKADDSRSSRSKQVLRRAAHLLACGDECGSGDEIEADLFGDQREIDARLTMEDKEEKDDEEEEEEENNNNNCKKEKKKTRSDRTVKMLKCSIQINRERKAKVAQWRTKVEKEDRGLLLLLHHFLIRHHY